MNNVLLVIVICGIMVLMGIYYAKWHQQHFNRIQEQELDRYASEVEGIYRQMRGIRHDYRNHLQVIEAHLKIGENAQVLQYVQELTNELNQVDTIIRTGNTMIDAIVNTKLTVAKEKGVQVYATAIAPSELPMNVVDLTIVLGNLLSNAVEATTHPKAKGTTQFIRLYIAPIRDNLYISITNTCVINPQPKFISLKRINRQGYGIRRIDQIVDKYKGIVNRKWEEGVFATEVTISLANEKE